MKGERKGLKDLWKAARKRKIKGQSHKPEKTRFQEDFQKSGGDILVEGFLMAILQQKLQNIRVCEPGKCTWVKQKLHCKWKAEVQQESWAGESLHVDSGKEVED